MKVKRANRLMSIIDEIWVIHLQKVDTFNNDWYLGQIFSLYTCNYGCSHHATYLHTMILQSMLNLVRFISFLLYKSLD